MMKPQFTIDVNTADNNSCITCPRCQTKLDPDADNDLDYSFINIVLKNDLVESMALLCHCGAEITLIGFHSVETEELKKESE